jgi:hypothetical protein
MITEVGSGGSLFDHHISEKWLPFSIRTYAKPLIG